MVENPRNGHERPVGAATSLPAGDRKIATSSAPGQERGDQAPIMCLRGIVKVYPGVNALKGVDLEVFPSEVHALVGENGAGKSTLLKIACGAIARTAGEVDLNGHKVDFAHPSVARAAGVVAVYQELTIIPALSAMANVFLGREQRKWGFLRRNAMLEEYSRVQQQLEVDINPDETAGRLSIADQQSSKSCAGSQPTQKS